jgi:CRISPR-associated protein Cmr6
MPDYSIPIPKKSSEAFWAYKENSPQNAGLIFERFAPDTQDDAKLKEKGLQASLDASKKADSKLLAAWNVRWTSLTKDAQTFSLQTDWRLIAGLGKKGSLEVGFTFHRYGFPYLPGSSLKGLARAAALLEIGEKLNIDILEILRKKVIETDKPKEPEKFGLLKALEIVLSREEEETCLKELNACQNPPSDAVTALAKTFRAVFGTTEHGGHVVFFDAIPSARVLPTLELDIMNPHYPDYYKETGQDNPQTPPANWQSPIPVKFLAVAPGTEFRFAVGWRKSSVDSTPIEALPTEKAQKEWRWFKGVVPAPSAK